MGHIMTLFSVFPNPTYFFFSLAHSVFIIYWQLLEDANEGKKSIE
jgi:hypothetical protein